MSLIYFSTVELELTRQLSYASRRVQVMRLAHEALKDDSQSCLSLLILLQRLYRCLFSVPHWLLNQPMIRSESWWLCFQSVFSFESHRCGRTLQTRAEVANMFPWSLSGLLSQLLAARWQLLLAKMHHTTHKSRFLRSKLCRAWNYFIIVTLPMSLKCQFQWKICQHLQSCRQACEPGTTLGKSVSRSFGSLDWVSDRGRTCSELGL